MSSLQHVLVGAMDPRRFEAVLAPAEYDSLLALIERGARELEGRVIWNVNSTAKGGGVVELLRPLLGYSRGSGVDARWVVVSGTADFFEITKRLHNHLHGFAGDGGPLGDEQRAVYENTLSDNAAELAQLVRPTDVVILHDPQTAGLTEAVRSTGATVIWRCHVGRDRANQYAHAAWNFLRAYVVNADAFVFSRAAFAWRGLPPDHVTVIQPSIDAFAPKNADQTAEQTHHILARAGIVQDGEVTGATFTRTDGSPGRVDRRAAMLEEQPVGPDDRLITQVSRWDRLKDPVGVLVGFAEHVAEHTNAHLMMAGPSTESVADDPEGAAVFAGVASAWQRLGPDIRRRVHLASLPMDDVEENAAIVNALQRRSDIVVQKSIAEGFGLTVAEAMWKGRPVIASRIGGIQDQIVDGESGVLLSDPRDLARFGAEVRRVLGDRELAERLGATAMLRVRDHFLGPRSLSDYFELIQRLISNVKREVPAWR